jgi:alkanesulfonate monooxygenase SsuD/methylene tetrahydromethanopterin reductase-like flavin-dependent oxidoreductase (luciferase family)
LFEGRFFLGVGTGEALNEHIAGHRWPRPEMRVAMLDAILASVDAYRAAGYDHLYFHQIGPDQDAFFQAWESELQKALTER